MTVAAEPRTTLLNQIIAVRSSVKGDIEKKLTKSHHLLQRSELLSGMVRTYNPHNEDDFRYPDETTQVQVKVEEILREVAADLTQLFDVTAAMDWTNQHARADVVLFAGDQPTVLLPSVPVAYLMFLEKQLVNLETLVRKLPILPAAERWTFDPASDVYRSDPVGTVKTKKVMRNHVKAEATDRHPAQVEMYTEDIPIGSWSTVKFSGALPASRVNKMLNRITALSQAVKFAREQANLEDVMTPNPGKVVFSYLFAPDE
jgi:hypothetical protein